MTSPPADASPPTPLPIALLAATALGAAVVGGVIYAFSTMIMPGLDELPDSTGIEAMQGFNDEAGAFFLAPWGLTALGSIALLWWAARAGAARDRGLVIGGALLFLVGVIVLTGAANIPLNDELAAADTDDAALWSDFVSEWTVWNHLRGAAALGSAALLGIAAVRATGVAPGPSRR